MRKPTLHSQASNRVPDGTVISSDPRATFVSSLERGTEKSCVFSVVYCAPIDDSVAGAKTMMEQNLARESRTIFRRERMERVTQAIRKECEWQHMPPNLR
jgi:hypothetical protein